jgi:hypothetical protein
MKQILLVAGFAGLTFGAWAQCTADFDFGTSLYGASPDATLGEQFDTAYLNEPYSDVFHVLVPVDASAIDPAFTLPLDSIILTTATLTDPNTGTSYAFADVGLEIVCNNNGVSTNPCSFHGGGQYCAVLTGTPTQTGVFDMTLDVQAYVTVFGIPIPQPYSFSGYVLTIGDNGAVIGVEEQNALPSLLAFPNPAQDVLTVSFDRAEMLEIRELTGRVVLEAQVRGQREFKTSVADWAPGMYTLALRGPGGVTTQSLLVGR